MEHTNFNSLLSLHKFIMENNIYIPKITNQEECWFYFYFIDEQCSDLQFEQNYEQFIQNYTTKNTSLNLDYEWIYYFIYMILYCDNSFVERTLYEEIIEAVKTILNNGLIRENKINAIKNIMVLCGKTHDVIDGFYEGDILNLLYEMIDFEMEDEFNIIVNEIKKSSLKSYRNIIPHIIDSLNNLKEESKYIKFLEILRKNVIRQINIENYIFNIVYQNYPDQILLQINVNDKIYKGIVSKEDVDYLDSVSDYFLSQINEGLIWDKLNVIFRENNIEWTFQNNFLFAIKFSD